MFTKVVRSSKLAPAKPLKPYNISMEAILKTTKKRVRYKIPSYRKVYSLYVYNRAKYGKIYKRLQKLALQYNDNIFYRVNPYNVLRLCYVYKEGHLQHLGDERHIYRYNALEGVLTELAQEIQKQYNLMLRNDVLLYLYKRTGIVFYNEGEDAQAEYMPVYERGIYTRLRTNIRLLRLIRAGVEVEDAIKVINTDRTPQTIRPQVLC